MKLDVPRHFLLLTWFPQRVSGAVELLDVYVKDVEHQVANSIAAYEQQAEQHEIESAIPDDPPELVTVHKGLDDDTWDLEEVFRYYFPALQRRSALSTLYSFFEHELNALCDAFAKAESYGLSVRDLTGTGIERARGYLVKVAGLKLAGDVTNWHEVRNIQAVRNLLVHSEGQLSQREGRDRALSAYIRKSPFLEGEKEVRLLPGYLEHVLATFNSYFNELHAAITVRYDASQRPVSSRHDA